jgi:hypothetical protein
MTNTNPDRMDGTYTPPEDYSPDVTTLRIRTPDFSTHDEAERKYYQKRRDRDAARRRRQILYGGLTLVAAGVVVYSWRTGFQPKMISTMLEFVGYAATSATCFILAFLLCRGTGWCDSYEKELAAEEEEDSEV